MADPGAGEDKYLHWMVGVGSCHWARPGGGPEDVPPDLCSGINWMLLKAAAAPRAPGGGEGVAAAAAAWAPRAQGQEGVWAPGACSTQPLLGPPQCPWPAKSPRPDQARAQCHFSATAQLNKACPATKRTWGQARAWPSLDWGSPCPWITETSRLSQGWPDATCIQLLDGCSSEQQQHTSGVGPQLDWVLEDLVIQGHVW